MTHLTILPRLPTVRLALAVLMLGTLVALCYHLVDRPAALWARGLDPSIVAVFRRITLAGSAVPYLVGLAVLYPVLRFPLRRAAAAKRALFVGAALALAGLSVNLLKFVVARWRPTVLLADPSQYGFTFFKTGYLQHSFPSGHAATSLALGCALGLMFPRLRALWLAAGFVVASSRVVIGEHYPGDVLAGAWFGVMFTLGLARTAWFREALQAPGPASPRVGDSPPGSAAGANAAS